MQKNQDSQINLQSGLGITVSIIFIDYQFLLVNFKYFTVVLLINT